MLTKMWGYWNSYTRQDGTATAGKFLVDTDHWVKGHWRTGLPHDSQSYFTALPEWMLSHEGLSFMKAGNVPALFAECWVSGDEHDGKSVL